MATVVQTDFGQIDIDTGEAQDVSASIAIFNPALKATDEGDNPIVVLIAAITDVRHELWVVDVDGKLKVKNLDQVTTDWRYDYKKEAWVDTGGQSLEVGE